MRPQASLAYILKDSPADDLAFLPRRFDRYEARPAWLKERPSEANFRSWSLKYTCFDGWCMLRWEKYDGVRLPFFLRLSRKKNACLRLKRYFDISRSFGSWLFMVAEQTPTTFHISSSYRFRSSWYINNIWGRVPENIPLLTKFGLRWPTGPFVPKIVNFGMCE